MADPYKGSYHYKIVSNGKTDEPKKPTEEKSKTFSHFRVFRHASLFEIVLMCIGVVSATANGFLLPPCIYIFAVMVNTISNEALANNSTLGASASNSTVIYDAVRVFAISNGLIGLGQLVFTYLAVMLFNYTSQRQAFRIRQLYLKSVLYQDISWYDSDMKSGNVATELTEDVIKLEEGIGEKIPEFIDHIAIFVSCFVFSFYYGWKLTSISLVTIPITVIVVAIVSRVISVLSKKELDAFGAASSVAEEVFSAIKTVFAFGGQQSEVDRYKKNLLASYKLNMKMGLASGCGFGFLWFGIYASCGLLLWYGVVLILEQRHLPIDEREYDASVLFSTFFCVMSAAMHIGAIAPYIEAFSVSKAAAAKIFPVIDKISMINSQDPNGLKLPAFQNCIEFKNVEFQYPSRPGVGVLKKLNLRIKKGETVALVGHSGCGKSTCIQLLQRFYDPLNGQILFDGHDLRELNIAWLRSNVGVVGQEPVLFDTTIAENIRYGNLDATMEMVVEAAKQSNAHDFIMKLPSKYDTLVGERGAQISGGQKQRIAIARALVGDPAILLLDEATSALDSQSESKVQAALDKAHQGRTSIIIAHKLSTIRDASKIIVISDGQVVEEGKHKDLMELKGCYYAMVVAQDTQFAQSPERQAAPNSRFDGIDEDLEPVTIKSEASDEEASKEANIEIGMWKILKLNRPEWKQLAMSAIMSLVVGSSMPLFSILFGDMLWIVSDPDEDVTRNESIKYSFYFLGFGVIVGLATFIQIFLLTVASESLTTRLRGFAFQAMVKQEMAWFDEPSNGVGALCAKLSTEAAAVKGATGQRIGTVIQSVSCLGLAVGLSLYYEWRLGLVGMTYMPVMYIITVMHDRVYKKETLNYYKCLEKSTKIAIEAVGNIRTVAGLGREEVFYKDYVRAVLPAFELAKKNTHYRGLVCGLFKSTGFFAYTAIMYYGGVLSQNNQMEFSSVLKVGEALIMGVIIVGETIIFAPNFRKGVIAAGKIIELLERVPKLEDPKEPKEMCQKDQADVNFNRVSFAYPTRPDVTVLNSLNLEVQSGKTIALIGSSGSGKSTVVKLLERFYDPLSGTIDFNGTNIAAVTQSSLRMSIGLVEQEPMIFARTIRENIAYGDNSRSVTMEEIIAAARKANIHNFVTSLPLGYETDLGNKGTMLSGGQKQRVAIARALVRSPKILLLDEATSALDTESEKIVQAALNEAKTGRTCILIAHRLSTIRDADKICVFSQGSIVESGSHDDLVRNGGLYYEMLYLQNGKRP